MSWILDEEVLAVLSAIVIVASVFAVAQAINSERIIEPFSELGLLGPNMKIGDYPKQVFTGIPFLLHIYIGNHEGKTMLYKILVKVSNESGPSFPSEPIMEFIIALQHNQSKIIPVEIILNDPGINKRLIFEMWILNGTNFVFYNRWNQLWLNVSWFKEGSKISLIDDEFEKSIINGYLSIRRAEEAGGNVTAMVLLLNKAIEEKSSIEQILLMEPNVIKQGEEIKRFQLLINIGLSAMIISFGIGAFIYLRKNIWLWWAKFYKKWKIIVKDKNIKIKNNIPLEEAIFSREKPHEVAKQIYKLMRNNSISLIDPNPPKSFLSYFKSRYNIAFMALSLLIALCIISIYGSDLSPIIGAFRIIIGSIFVLFLPGYALIEALYPEESNLSPLERFALSIGLSLALVPLVGLLLNYTPWGIRLNPILASLSILSLSLALISSYRKFQLLTLKILEKKP
ncbi:MAG: DUF1616 domain-containing protein [Candidatus Methanomethyliaceae archaeon]|nr:DUF1616 domain-containing protein [Candidatus Methanomethyliaceae archaeon]MDW7971364.1 DUF1616 domain-containing protein [Nitrososphaerota archaeon]